MAGRNHSEAVSLVVSTLNLGTRSARDLFWAFVFEGFPEQGQVLSPHGVPMYSVVQAGTSESAEPLKLVPHPRGWVRMVSRLPYLHPGTWQKYGFTVYVPKGKRSIDLMVLVSAADIQVQQTDLEVNINGEPE
jgi:hypothetical protein